MLKLYKYCKIFLLFPFILLAGCKATIAPGDYVGISDIMDVYEISDNVYIGKLIAVGEEKIINKQEGISLYPEWEKSGIPDDFSYTFNKLEIAVTENIKGRFLPNQTIEDWIPHEYFDFLEAGSTYLFMSCDNFKRIIQQQFIIYDAVKIEDNEQIVVYKFDEYEETYTSVGGFPYSPNTLPEVRQAFIEMERIIARKNNYCVCQLTPEQRQSLRTDKYYDQYGLICEKHNKDFREDG